MSAVTMHHFSGLAAPFVRSKGTVSGGVFTFPDLFGFSREAENKNNNRFWCPEQRMRTERGLIRKIGQKRLSCGPTIFAKKLQKSREAYNFTAFSGGPDRIRTDDPHNANVVRSQLRYRPIFSYFVYFSLICLCSLLF